MGWKDTISYECGPAGKNDVVWSKSTVRKKHVIVQTDNERVYQLGVDRFKRYSDINPTKDLIDNIKTDYLKYLCHNSIVRYVFIDETPDFGSVNDVLRKRGKKIMGFESVNLLNIHVIKHVLGMKMCDEERAERVYETIYRPRLQKHTTVKLRDWYHYYHEVYKICPAFFDSLKEDCRNIDEFEVIKNAIFFGKCSKKNKIGEIHQVLIDISEAYEEWIKHIVLLAINGSGKYTSHFHVINKEEREVIYTWTDEGEIAVLEEAGKNKAFVVRTAFIMGEESLEEKKNIKNLKGWLINHLFMNGVYNPVIHPNRTLFGG